MRLGFVFVQVVLSAIATLCAFSGEPTPFKWVVMGLCYGFTATAIIKTYHEWDEYGEITGEYSEITITYDRVEEP